MKVFRLLCPGCGAFIEGTFLFRTCPECGRELPLQGALVVETDRPVDDSQAAAVAKFERAFLQGEQAVWQRLLGLAFVELNQAAVIPPDRARVAKLVIERAAVVAQLRSLCGDFGDNEWEPSDHLADVLDNHLGKHLHGRQLGNKS